jgi:hypothetical protein
MRCLQRNVTCLHQKWCVQSIPPLGPRAKQPDFHVHAKCTLQDVTATLTRCLHWDVELARFVLVAGGGERSGPNMLWLLFSFMVRLSGGWGETFRRLSVSETATHVTGHDVSQQCQIRMRNCAAMRVEFITKHIQFGFESEDWEFLKILAKVFYVRSAQVC